MEPIYLDYNATTPLDPMVSEAIRPYFHDLFGNPSSIHMFGSQATRAVMTARAQVAAALNCHPDEVVFTGGGTESNNWAIKGIAYANKERGNHIISTGIEHPSIDEVCRFLEEEGWEVTRVGVDRYGIVDPDDIRKAIRPGTVLVTVMHANNETGSIQPITEIGRITHDAGIPFHSDAAQSVGKIPVDVTGLGVDLLSLAGHKLYAPKGVGALYIRRGVRLAKFMHGAGHEADRRAGTENVTGIVGLGKASSLFTNDELGMKNLQHLRDRLFEGIRKEIPEIRLNGHPDLRLPNTLSLGFPGVQANLLLQAMNGVAASAGAACHAGEERISGVLEAMNVPSEFAMGTIRFSVGRMTTEEEVRRAIPIIVTAFHEVKGITDHGSGIREADTIRLTTFSHSLGCACKIRPQLLEKVLRNLPPVTDPRVLVGPEGCDDAAVFRLNEDQAIVQTVDVIPPVVDDPFTFGMITAANALSDIYAMGAQPLFALNIAGFPETRLPPEVLFRIQEGASRKAAEAGIQIVGGHSLELDEPLFGLVVTGLVEPQKVLRNHGLKEGDAIVLTKPIGTGILSTALKRELLDQKQSQALIESMTTLNGPAAGKMRTFSVHACTDVTGFGLIGHLLEMVADDKVDVVVNASAVPVFEGTGELAAQGVIPGGTRNNLSHVNRWVTWTEQVSEVMRLILCDAQTSGGLLLGLPEQDALGFSDTMMKDGLGRPAIIGKVIAGNGKITIGM